MDRLLKVVRTRTDPAYTTVMPMRTPILWSEALLNSAREAPGQEETTDQATPLLHDPTVPRNMHDSYSELVLPFGSSSQVKEEYINAWGGIRTGKLMEHLDSLAGSIAYKHMLGPGVQTLGRIQERGFYIVTASVDRLDMLAQLNPSRDLRLSGQVIYTGRSSMEVAVKMESVGLGLPEETVLLGRFSMVCRDANTHKARAVNPLIISTPEERSLYKMGEQLKHRRQSVLLRSLSRVPPSLAEAEALHSFYLRYGQHDCSDGGAGHDQGERIWMGDTLLEKCMLMFPQERNVHQKVFGGYLMRLAYELGFTNASLFTRGQIRFLSLDGISFKRPVPIGSILRLRSQILHTGTHTEAEFPMLVHVGVKANVVDVKTGSEQTTNDFRFTWCREEGEGVPRKVVPKTYKEAMLWLEGKRALALGEEIRVTVRHIRRLILSNAADTLAIVIGRSSDRAAPTFLAVSAASLTKELASMSSFPPATAAVSIMLLILQTVQRVQSNKETCTRLARRCARILLDINEQMVGRWDTAPPGLIRNLETFQDTLTSIHEFMKKLTDTAWPQRFMKKASIENAIVDYTAQLQDATQSFQIATLVDIHYAVSTRATKPKSCANIPPPPHGSGTDGSPPTQGETRPDSPIVMESPVGIRPSTPASDIPVVEEPEEEGLMEHIVSADVLETRGFRRYHQSEVRLKGTSNMKGGWWTGVNAGEVEGRPTLIKRYEGSTEQPLGTWIHDVKLLQNVFHPSLPQMIGFSEDSAPTPFILLSNVQTRSPQALLLNTLQCEGLAACADLIVHFYQDVVDATLYVQRQRGLDDTLAQDFVDNASFRVDGSKTIIMGLPPPKDGWLTVRNYGLTESLKTVVLRMLPKGGTIQYSRDSDEVEDGDIIRRLSHLVTLVRGLLPADNAPVTLSSRVEALIRNKEDDEENDYFGFKGRPKLALRQLRLSNIEANTHEHTWRENSNIPPHKFSVGDFGYIPHGGDFKGFVTLGNVLKEDLAKLEIESHARGVQWSWKDSPIRRVPMEPFALPGDVICWTLAVPTKGEIDCQISHWSAVAHVADAWRFLLLHGKVLAVEHNIKPEELMLVTNAGTNQDFKIHDFATSPLSMQPTVYQRFGSSPAFGHNRPGFDNETVHHRMLPYQSNIPTVMYLLTSSSADFVPYWSHNPVPMPSDSRRPNLKHGWTYRIGWCTGFINWIQLHQEDFAE
ncbi:putative thioesterase thiol ester dehydrase-isomerase [Lyophyllum shimeji]|uniref:Thioesterase thiol ester dehydrase-isomerase n=1 Tax=Lyophyllum shimeji TaxID=47721 RepID=A0A9P3UTI9_LYOSH|nr:putative thioesterase thiol ester dehydrase-isomerase [Lyophyllum shimeji]